MQEVSPNDMKGIDVSHWQGIINFEEVKNAGYELVYLKATEGKTYVDPNFYEYYKGAKNEGMKVGFYHFFRPENESSTIAQAKHFVNTIEGLEPDMLLALDIEATGGLSRDEISRLSLLFLKEVTKMTGLDLVVYTYNYFAQEYLNESLGDYPVWIADYSGKVILNNQIWEKWVGYQYTDKGQVPGIKGNVDLNWFTNGIFLPNRNHVVNDNKKVAHNKTKQQPKQTKQPATVETNIAYYRVIPGDTLETLAIIFNTTPEDIIKLNNLEQNTNICPGQIIKVNAELFMKKQTPPTYTVKMGDTLNSIAKKFNTSVNSLVKINNIQDPNMIYAGQLLKIQNNA